MCVRRRFGGGEDDESRGKYFAFEFYFFLILEFVSEELR